MKDSIQKKIDQITELAKVQHLEGRIYSSGSNLTEDNLLKAIRNEEDATLFMAELDAAIRVSKSK